MAYDPLPIGVLPVSSALATNAQTNASTTGNIVNNGDIVSHTFNNGDSSLTVQLAGTWTGQVNFEATLDGTNWVSHEMTSAATVGGITNAASGNGLFEASIGGLSMFRVRATTAMTGTLNVTMKSSVGTHAVELDSQIPAGTNNIGFVNIAGSVATISTPPANQSVSGTVGASVIGLTPIQVPGSVAVAIVSGSIAASFTPPANQSVSGTVTANQGTTPWTISSVYGNVSGSIAGTYANSNTPSTVTGIAMMFKQNVVTSVMTEVSTTFPLPVSIMGLTPVNVTNTNVNVSGSVVAQVTGLQGHSVSGTVATTQAGTWISSVVNTVPSSMLVGASIIGLTPVNVTNTNVNVSGSVVAFGFPTTQNVSGSVVATISGTPNVNTAGSVIAFMGGTWKPSVINLVTRNDTLASFLGADLVERPMMSDAIGRTVIKPFASEDSTIISYVGSIVSGSVQLIQASAIGKKSYITDFWLSNTGATTTLVTFQGGDTSIVGQFIAPTGGGMSSPGIAIPLKTTASQDLAFKVSPSTSVLYLMLKGYQAQ